MSSGSGLPTSVDRSGPEGSFRRRLALGSLSLALSLVSTPTLAAPSARLVYVREPGAEGCAGEEGLRRAVAARLGYDPFFPWAKVTVVAVVHRESGAFHAEVSLVDEAGVSRGRRTLAHDGDDCGPLVSALALSVSLALDPRSLTRNPTPAPAPPPAEAPKPAPPPQAPPEEPASPLARRLGDGPAPLLPPAPAWHGFAALAALGSYGVTPGVASGGLLRMKLERASFALAVEAGAEAPTSALVPVRGQVQAWSADATLLGCARLSVLVGCGFVSVGPLFTRGVGLAVARSATVAYGAAGPRLGLEIPVGSRFRVEAFAQFAFAWVPRDLQVDGMDVFRQPRAAPSAGVGGSARIF